MGWASHPGRGGGGVAVLLSVPVTETWIGMRIGQEIFSDGYVTAAQCCTTTWLFRGWIIFIYCLWAT